MNILIINAGSSSLKSQLLVNGKKHRVLAKFHADGIGKDTCRCTFSCEEKNFGQNIKLKNHEEAIRLLFEKLKSYKVIEKYSDIEAVGHRVVHGGEKYKQPVKIDSKVLKEIKNLCKLAPLHNPPNLEGIRITKKILKKTPQIAIFDTGYHHSLPEKAYLYGLPYSFYKKKPYPSLRLPRNQSPIRQ